MLGDVEGNVVVLAVFLDVIDSATQGAAQLVYKSYIRTYTIEGLRQIIATGGPQMAGLAKYVDMMRTFQSIEGITLLDSKDTFAVQQHSLWRKN